MKSLFAAALPAAFLLAGCTTTDTAAGSMAAMPAAALDGTELHGRTVRVTVPGGPAWRTMFNPDWTFVSTFADGRTARGSYRVEGQRLCFTAAGQAQPECWPYDMRLEPGRTYMVTAPNGQQVQVMVES